MLIRSCLILAIAVISFGCADTSGPAAPTSASSLERQATAGEFATPLPLTNPAGLESDIEFGPVPAEGELATEFPAEFDIAPSAEVDVDAAALDEQSLAAPDFAVPGKPTNVVVTSNNLTITMTWGPSPAGTAGMPTRYLVYCSCTGKIESVGPLVFLKVWVAKAPGTYTGFVLGGNSKGSGPTVNYKVTIGFEGTYTSAAVSQTSTLIRKFSGFTCTWRITMSVTATVVITGAKAGTGRVAGTWSTPKPSAKCNGGSAAFTNQAALTFTATGFSSSHTLDLVTAKIEGAFVGATIKGFVRMVYRYGTGRYDIPFTLKKT